MALKVQTITVVDDSRNIINVLTYNGYTPANSTTSVTAGSGLTGGGTLAASRTLSVGQGDGITVGATTVGVDATVARTTTSVTAGSGLTGGGTLAASRTLAVGQGDGITVGATTVSVNPGLGIIANSTGVHIGAGNGLNANSTLVFIGQGDGITVGATTVGVDSSVARTTTSITAGNGLSGGGTLAATRTFTVGQGDGITVGTTTVGVDSTVVRTTGNQTLAGTKFFSGNLETSSTSGAWGAVLKPGVALTNIPINANATWAWRATDTASAFVAGIQFLNNSPAIRIYTGPSSYIGFTGSVIDDASISTNMVRTSTTFTAGNGMLGGGNLSASRTFSVGQGDGITVDVSTVAVDSTVVRTTGNQTLGGVKTFSSTISGNISGSAGSAATSTMLTTPRTFTIGSTGKTFDGTANVAWTLAEIGGLPLTGAASITTVGTITSGVWNAGAVTSSSTITSAGLISGSANIKMNSGSSALPGYSFNTSANIGMYLIGTDTLGFSTGGTIAASFTSTGNLRLYNTAGTFYSEFSNQPTANRTLTFPDANVTLVSGTMVPTTVFVASGNGLSGGGDLSSGRTLTVGQGDGITVGATTVAVDSSVARTTTSITPGNGLSGGGTLAATRTLTVGQGDGITVGATTVGVDSTVVRTTGNQTLAGTKTFTVIPVCEIAPTAGSHLANKTYVDSLSSTLTQAQVENPSSTVFGAVSGERLGQAAKANLNATGSAPMFACRAWVNFNGTGTVAIRTGGNVSSITDNGVGVYTLNFTTAMPNANYAVLVTTNGAAVNDSSRNGAISTATETSAPTNKSTTQLAIVTGLTSAGAARDLSEIYVAIIG